jgi:hypothetical protein
MLPVLFAIIQVWTVPQTSLFIEESPTVAIETNATHPSGMQWQLSETADFEAPYDAITCFHHVLSLPYPLFKSETDYYFRSRILYENEWSDWSLPVDFQVVKSKEWVKSAYVTNEVWDQVKPYLLPENHPIRPQLDELFRSQRAILSEKSMEKAGFTNPSPRKWTHLIVTKHPDFPGYIFKLYLDAQRYHNDKPEYVHWIERASGAQAIQHLIEENGWQSEFKTPKKWIYPLPDAPSPPKEFIRKNFIIVEEDMEILSHKDNYSRWKTAQNKDKLLKLYTICETLGVHDSKPDNMPFSHDGKIAFVDTQPMFTWPVAYAKITPFLSDSLKKYWKQLIKGSRKK